MIQSSTLHLAVALIGALALVTLALAVFLQEAAAGRHCSESGTENEPKLSSLAARVPISEIRDGLIVRRDVVAGFLEGRWARSNQKALVKMHSPMRFSLALVGLGFMPALALLWITAPVAVPATLLVFTLGAVAVMSSRNLVVHAPTQF
jgi:hypothetical protein